MPTEMTMRDHFAAAALTGLLANGDYGMDSTPGLAWRMADAMLRERERKNHDAAPAARADLPDECPPNAVSANGGTPCAASRDGSGTGGTQEPVACETNERSVASAGSVAERPLGDPEIAVEILRLRVAELEEAIRRLADQDATLSVCDGNVTVEMDATLTDAEREAVLAMACHCDTRSGLEWVRLSATLRGLLERTK